ncbi:guanine deaminase [Bradyrhizobium jicamae]|uniref:Guanine deaminase n=1 Tax=Bradyrhizobium jicamae TaxID=280332 RepID=A0ABS5FET2_9BRAD|nr:guanine deaminase [Bradyrhizobium jicamae]MBR0795295.1 guanine deaminase [Bradyrhizobium jicamae]
MSPALPVKIERALRGRLLSFHADPRIVGPDAGHRYIEDGVVLMSGGRIVAVGEATALLQRIPTGTAVDDHRGRLILPGFVDTHIHYPQTRVIGSYGEQLLEWLQKYTFVEEQRLRDRSHAEHVARFFFDELLRHGTTTAAVYCSVHPESVEAFFAESERRGTRMVAGKVMMDRNAPEALTDTAESGYRESRALLRRWHGRGRQLYAITPRFAITSTPEQLEASGALVREFPDAYVQTHLGENLAEIALVKEMFPAAKTYADVYQRYGLLGPKSIFGHCIYLEDSEVEALAASGSVAAFCPTSNLFLGSGLFDMRRLQHGDVRVGVATDVGGGTTYSMLQTANEAYKVLQMQGQRWPALQAFYMMTRGNASVLGLGDRIGSLENGREADIIVLDARATPAMAHRMECIDGNLAEELFLLMTLGDDRCVVETYVAGRPAKPM